MKNGIKIIALLMFSMLVFSQNAMAGSYEVSGNIIELIDHGDGTVTVKMDTNNDGKSDFERTFHATTEQARTLKDAYGDKKPVNIKYHNEGSNLVIDSVQIINGIIRSLLDQQLVLEENECQLYGVKL